MRIRMELKIYGNTLDAIQQELQTKMNEILSASEASSADVEIEVEDSRDLDKGNYMARCYIKVNG